MSNSKLIDTIPLRLGCYDEESVPDGLKSLQVRVLVEEDEQFITLAVDCGKDTSIMLMRDVCPEHWRCIADSLLIGFEMGYSRGVDDVIEDFEHSQKNNANR